MAKPTGTRQESVRRTDEAVFGALEAAIAQSGWDSVTASGVARQAGVTVGAIYSRAESMSELANLAWTRSIGPRFLGALGDIVRSSRDDDAEGFDRVIAEFDAYAKSAAPALELAVASLFDDELDEVVGTDLRTGFTEIIFGRDHSRHEAACATLVLAYFCGRAMARGRRPRLPKVDPAGRVVHQAFWRAAPLEFGHDERADVVFLRDAGPVPPTPLDRAVIEVTAQYGYKRGTIARIARRAGLTPGAVLAKGSSKADLVARAAEVLLMSPREVWENFVSASGGSASGRTRATFVRAFVHHGYEQQWRLSLEFARVGETVEELSAFRTPRDVLQETHQGLMLVACFAQGIDDLPYLGPFQAGSAT